MSKRFSFKKIVFIQAIVLFAFALLSFAVFASSEAIAHSSQSDFSGTFEGTEYSGGKIKLTSAANEGEGTYTSQIIDAGSNVHWISMTWEEDLPSSETDIYFKVRSCDDPVCSGEEFSEEDVMMMEQALTVSNNRYFQYKAFLTGTASENKYDYGNIIETPSLFSVSISYEHATENGICGNGIVESPEVCDGTNLNGKTCQNLGFANGALACYSSDAGSELKCTYDTRNCMQEEQPECMADSNCPAGQKCQNNLCVEVAPPVECTDSDGKADPFLRGKTYGLLNRTYETKTDTCLCDNIPCLSGGGSMEEYYCVGNEINFMRYRCYEGCEDGACRREEFSILQILRTIKGYIENILDFIFSQ